MLIFNHVDLVFGWDHVDIRNRTYPHTRELVPTNKDKLMVGNSPGWGEGTTLRHEIMEFGFQLVY